MFGMKKKSIEKYDPEFVIAIGARLTHIKGNSRRIMSFGFFCFDGSEHHILLMPQQVEDLRGEFDKLFKEYEKTKYLENDPLYCDEMDPVEAI